MTPQRIFAGGLSLRVTLLTLAVGLSAVVGVFLAISVSARAAREALISNSVTQPAALEILAACDSSTTPIDFRRGASPVGPAFDAYTLEGVPLSVGAPAIDRDLIALLQAGDSRATQTTEQGYTVFVRRDGRCAVIRIHWEGRVEQRRSLMAILTTSVAVTTLGVPLLVSILVLKPLRKRIGRIRSAAQRVGRDDFDRLSPKWHDELDELGEAIDAAHLRVLADAELLRKSRDAMKQFLADVAHDLRTPITSMRLTLDELEDVLFRPGATRGSAERLIGEVVYLGSLTDNLQIASRLDGGWDPMEGNPVANLTSIVRRVGQRGETFARRKRVSLAVAYPDVDVLARVEPTLSEQAFTNLVENAIAYGYEGGHVAVRLELLDEKAVGQRFELTVEDDGPGAREDELPRLVERRYRTSAARQRPHKGTGLGLAIVGAVCEMAGWQMTVERTMPTGLRVRIIGSAQQAPP
jgi:signal transduction histidine kinase